MKKDYGVACDKTGNASDDWFSFEDENEFKVRKWTRNGKGRTLYHVEYAYDENGNQFVSHISENSNHLILQLVYEYVQNKNHHKQETMEAYLEYKLVNC
jgi:hypothetical protein